MRINQVIVSWLGEQISFSDPVEEGKLNNPIQKSKLIHRILTRKLNLLIQVIVS